MSISVQNNAAAGIGTTIDNLQLTDIHQIFMQLQLKESQNHKQAALNQIDEIKKSQELQKECQNFIDEARKQQMEAKNGDKTTEASAELVKFCKDNGISLDTKGNDNRHYKDEWDYNIKSLTNFMEGIGTDRQTRMVFVQDYMGQYNAMLQGAKSSSDQKNELSKTLAR